MRTREMSLSDHGVTPDDAERLKKYCLNLDIDDRSMLLECAVKSSPGIEVEIYNSIVRHEGYRTMLKRGWDIPIKEDDFYAYRRKVLGVFYKKLVDTGKIGNKVGEK